MRHKDGGRRRVESRGRRFQEFTLEANKMSARSSQSQWMLKQTQHAMMRVRINLVSRKSIKIFRRIFIHIISFSHHRAHLFFSHEEISIRHRRRQSAENFAANQPKI